MDFIRKLVSGPKNRYKENGYNLDLTYICPRLIAMSYPASGMESIYRNPIKKVLTFIKEKHQNNYLVFNISGRHYDSDKLEDRVLEYAWEDHHAPQIHILFQICQKIQYFLSLNPQNVCIIHCLAGKGRTGTIICCFLIYSGLINSSSESLQYYSKKRFMKDGFGVSQPCQVRYLQYFENLIKSRFTSSYPKVVFIKKLIIKGCPSFNTQNGCRPFVDIIQVKTEKIIHSTKKSYFDQQKFENTNEFEIQFSEKIQLCGDILIKLKHNGYYKNQSMARITLNTIFIPDGNNIVMNFPLRSISPNRLTKDKRFPKDFQIDIYFEQFCNCTRYTSFQEKCSKCSPFVTKEQEDSIQMLFGEEKSDVDQVLQQQMNQQKNQEHQQKEQKQNYQQNIQYQSDEIEDDFNIQTRSRSKNVMFQDKIIIEEKSQTDLVKEDPPSPSNPMKSYEDKKESDSEDSFQENCLHISYTDEEENQKDEQPVRTKNIILFNFSSDEEDG